MEIVEKEVIGGEKFGHWRYLVDDRDVVRVWWENHYKEPHVSMDVWHFSNISAVTARAVHQALELAIQRAEKIQEELGKTNDH